MRLNLPNPLPDKNIRLQHQRPFQHQVKRPQAQSLPSIHKQREFNFSIMFIGQYCNTLKHKIRTHNKKNKPKRICVFSGYFNEIISFWNKIKKYSNLKLRNQ